jgi:hypothetical protein
MNFLFAAIWIRRGRMAAGSAQEFFAEQREISRWLRESGW